MTVKRAGRVLAALAAIILCLSAFAASEESGGTAPEPYAFDIPESFAGSLLAAMGYAYADCYVVCTALQRVYIIPMTGEGDLTLNQGNGVSNTFHVTRDSVYMSSSTCENQDCVEEGTVTADNKGERLLGNMIICLPHSVTLELYTYEELEAILEASARQR